MRSIEEAHQNEIESLRCQLQSELQETFNAKLQEARKNYESELHTLR